MQRCIYPNQHRVSKPIHRLKGGVIWGILSGLSTSTIKLSQRRDYRDNLISIYRLLHRLAEILASTNPKVLDKFLVWWNYSSACHYQYE